MVPSVASSKSVWLWQCWLPWSQPFGSLRLEQYPRKMPLKPFGDLFSPRIRPWLSTAMPRLYCRRMMGLLRLPQDPALNQAIIDDYTGTGEVVGVHQFGPTLRCASSDVCAKTESAGDLGRSQDAKPGTFVGSATENTALRELPDIPNSPSADLLRSFRNSPWSQP